MSTLSAPVGGYREAFLINLASAAGGSLTSFGVSLLLARLMMPAELGLVAIALALMGIVQVLRDFGVGACLQRAPTLDQHHFSSCLGLLYGSTLLLGLLLLAAGGPLARHFGQPALQPLLNVLLLGFAITVAGIGEPPSTGIQSERVSLKPLEYVRDVLAHRQVAIYLLATFFFWLGNGGVAPFLTRFAVGF